MAISAAAKFALNRMNSTAWKYQLGTLLDEAGSVAASEIAVTDGYILVGNASNVGAAVAVTGDVTITNAGVTAIASGVIVNADVSGSAAIAFSKLAALTDGYILVGNGSNVAVAVAVTGDVTISNAGVTAIGSGVIVNADVSGSAAIDFSKLAALTDGYVLVGNGSNVATAVAVTGDVTISNAGVTAIGANKVVMSMMNRAVVQEATGTITQANMLALSTPVQLIAAGGSGTVIVVDEIEIFHDYAVAAYATGSDVAFEYETSGDNIALVVDTFFTAGADASTIIKPSTYNLDGSTGTASGFDVTANANKGIFVTASDFTLGDATNIFKYRIRYHLVTLLT